MFISLKKVKKKKKSMMLKHWNQSDFKVEPIIFYCKKICTYHRGSSNPHGIVNHGYRHCIRLHGLESNKTSQVVIILTMVTKIKITQLQA